MERKMQYQIRRILPSSLEKINRQFDKGFVLNSYTAKDEKGRLYLIFNQSVEVNDDESKIMAEDKKD